MPPAPFKYSAIFLCPADFAKSNGVPTFLVTYEFTSHPNRSIRSITTSNFPLLVAQCNGDSPLRSFSFAGTLHTSITKETSSVCPEAQA